MVSGVVCQQLPWQPVCRQPSNQGLVIQLHLRLFTRLSRAIEITSSNRSTPHTRFGLHRSRRTVFKLSALFSLNAFAGGLIVQSFVAYWFVLCFHADPAVLGGIFFGANLLAGMSALLAARVANRIGLINTIHYRFFKYPSYAQVW
jgi:hypothetical protein